MTDSLTPFDPVACEKVGRPATQYDNRKGGPHTREFLLSLTHGNSKNEIRYRTDEYGKKRGACMERSKSFMKEKKSRLPITTQSKYNINI